MRNPFRYSPPDSVTSVVTKERGRWKVAPVLGGTILAPAPALKIDDQSSLSAAVSTTSKAIDTLYRQRKKTSAELQFAIYPWPTDDIEFIFDVTGSYRATEIQGSNMTAQAETLEDLVNAIETLVQGKSAATMLRMIVLIG